MVDLEKELEQWRHAHFKGKRDGDYAGEWLERESQLSIASHFYELGIESKKCRPKESWSRGDEKIMNALVDYIGSSHALGVDLQMAKCWLKDLPKRIRPSWKPSEVQMDVLKYASTYVPDDEETLASLYYDLKKLM